ncbi:bifunctional folylpolyglutamate synthase/ dihydrofolate synthase [Candidatus Omnitrophus magneticus]|uniref:Dihydrofolate synthase/folylpolyglutamate synthase n=1 Tax=Candidatus Omnitrophus magneticus TaxID=1609969 RepID=A0A0F0CQL8_9BACT|nr:bifunctional folylpolyglutamate synthase/ dihydrofolate synthase [Candidatus Omnitrophus magneticus]
MEIKNYTDALAYLDSFINYEHTDLSPLKKEQNLKKLLVLLEHLVSPQNSYKSIHIAGTKGKGSISAITASILKSLGYRVGVFSSPHVTTVRERISFNNQMITEEEFTEQVSLFQEKLEPYLSRERYSFFEVLTIISMIYFAGKKSDYVVFECGLGGRFDATNIIKPEVCAFSPISYDHMEILGNTIEKIACEKAAIIKENVKCVSAFQREAGLDVIKRACEDKNVPLRVLGNDITYDIRELKEECSLFDIKTKRGKYENCRINMPGDFQVENASVSIGIVEELFPGIVLPVQKLREGLLEVFLPARLEVVASSPKVIIDGAHNGESAKRMIQAVRKIFKYKKIFFILGFSKDKDITGILKEIVPFGNEFIFTKFQCPRAISPEIVRGYIKNKDASIANDVKSALGIAFKSARNEDIIVVTGSFFLAGEVRDCFLNIKN